MVVVVEGYVVWDEGFGSRVSAAIYSIFIFLVLSFPFFFSSFLFFSFSVREEQGGFRRLKRWQGIIM